MNVKSIYETLTALGAGAMIVGCGAPQAPVNTAEQPAADGAQASVRGGKEEPDATSTTPAAVASSDAKPTATTAEVASPAATTPAPVAAKATAVPKKPAAATTGKTVGKKKDASASCGEGGCG